MSSAAAVVFDQDTEDFESFVVGGRIPKKMELLKSVLDDLRVNEPRREIRPTRPELKPVFRFGTGADQHILRAPLAVKVYAVGEMWAMENDFLELLSYGSDQREAYAAFVEALDVMFKEIGQANPESLAPYALSLRAKLLEIVES